MVNSKEGFTIAQPIIYNINAFDANKSANIAFSYSGEQVFGSEMVVQDNETGTEILTIKTEKSMAQYCTISPGALQNGKYYACRVRVFSQSGAASAWSEVQQFYCFSTPVFEFSSLKANQIIKSNQHILTVTYTQNEQEPLNHFHITLHNASKAVLAQSDELYAAAGKFEYQATALEDGTQYYARAVGATVHGMQVDTGYIPFSVSYVQNDYWAYIDLQNNENDGNIRISCNIKSITGIYSGNGSPIYVRDNTAIDLRAEGSKVTFPNEFVIDGDFALKIHGCQFVSGKEILVLEGKNGRIDIKYIEGYFNSYSLTDPCAYFVLRAEQYGVVYTVLSNRLDLPGDTMIYLDMRREGHLFSIKCRAVSE